MSKIRLLAVLALVALASPASSEETTRHVGRLTVAVDESSAYPGGLVTVDVNGEPATNGQYLFPFGIGLGGIDIPAFDEINLDGLNTPTIFAGIPWNLDRRLGPGGCIDTDGDGVVDCETTPQPLAPFPFEGLDPRFQASGLPTGPYTDPAFTASPLSHAYDRILSFVDPGKGKFDGNATVLAWPPAEPAPLTIVPTPEVVLVCSMTSGVPSGTSLNVSVANFGVATATWFVSGTSTVPGEVITIHLGDTLSGTVVGTATVPATAPLIWTFQQAGSLIPPDATQRISVESAGGASVLSVLVNVR